ncbi:MAG TPA: SET domain-containing protein [Candidatus Paceibacterota bacterium]|nr:SET domain-containing protein [Candidatus Paceibacterota bacterium]
MLLVKTQLKPSAVEGFGIFAVDKIAKGTSVWKFDPRFDLVFEPEDVEKMEPLQRDMMQRYAYLSIDSKKYVYCGDDGRFMNHSSTKNNLDVVQFPGEPETRGVANRDIESGEEILINYRSFDAVDATSDEPYLNS